MSKEGNAESKKWLMYINRTVCSDTHLAFSLCSASTFQKYCCCYSFYAF